jgi:Nif-specific regulatory protein
MQVANLERELISEALRQSRGNQSQAAKMLDTSLRILGYKIKQYDLDYKRFRAAGKHPPYPGGEKGAGEGY